MKQILLSGLVAAVFFSCVTATPVHAQRQTPGRPSVEVFSSFGKDVFQGFGFTWNNHFYHMHSSFGAEWFTRPGSMEVYVPAPADVDGNPVGLEENSFYGSDEFDAFGGLVFRLWAPRKRWMIINAGLYLNAGVRTCNGMKNYEYDGKRLPSTYFLFGLIPEVHAEFFPFKNVSLFAGFRPRVYIFGMPFKAKVLREGVMKENGEWFLPAASVGVKLYI